MTDREKLIELLRNMPIPEITVFGQRCGKALVTAEFIANHLIANGVTVQQWIPFTEPPKKMKPVICLYENEDGTQVGGGYVNDHGIWTLIAPAKGTITHWTPLNLPQPPKGE